MNGGWHEWYEVNDPLVTVCLRHNHYLGPAKRGAAWVNWAGVIVVSNPSSRRLPHDTWLELTRWCLTPHSHDRPNAGSQTWAQFVRALRERMPHVTTIVSYSDPSQGHTGALYRACNWWWAPTWHRLRPPPSGNGSWQEGKTQSVKDRWVFALRRDSRRQELLCITDGGVLRRFPWARYAEPGGVPYSEWKKISPKVETSDYKPKVKCA